MQISRVFGGQVLHDIMSYTSRQEECSGRVWFFSNVTRAMTTVHYRVVSDKHDLECKTEGYFGGK